MSEPHQPLPYPGPGRPLGAGHDPSSAPTQVGPPAVPPVAAPPPPPAGPPPVALPPYGQGPYGQGPYGQGPWGPPQPPGGRGSKVGLVIGLLALALVLIGGGVTAFLVLRDEGKGSAETSSPEDDRADRADRADRPDEPDEPETRRRSRPTCSLSPTRCSRRSRSRAR